MSNQVQQQKHKIANTSATVEVVPHVVEMPHVGLVREPEKKDPMPKAVKDYISASAELEACVDAVKKIRHASSHGNLAMHPELAARSRAARTAFDAAFEALKVHFVSSVRVAFENGCGGPNRVHV